MLQDHLTSGTELRTMNNGWWLDLNLQKYSILQSDNNINSERAVIDGGVIRYASIHHPCHSSWLDQNQQSHFPFPTINQSPLA